LQLGGIDELTASGTFTSLPNYTGVPSFIYGPTSSNCIIGAFNEMNTSSGPITIGNLTVNDAEGLVSNNSLNLTNLTLNGGNMVMGSNNLVIGSSTTAIGALQRNSGLIEFTSGSMTRWYASSTGIVGGYNTGFPIASGINERAVQVSTNVAMTTGGSISVRHQNNLGFTDISPSFADSIVTIDRRSNSSWIIQTSGFNLNTALLTLKFISTGLGSVSNVAGLRLIRNNNGNNGTPVIGSGSNNIPEVSRIFDQTQLAAGQMNDTFYYGSVASVNPLSPAAIAIASGSWNNPSTWDINAIPSPLNAVIIPSSFNVTVPSGSALSCSDLSINSNASLTVNQNTLNISGVINLDGTLNIGGGTVNLTAASGTGVQFESSTGNINITSGSLVIGPTGGSNRTLNVLGSVNVSGGTLEINGNLIIAAGSSFTQLWNISV
jgi:hypothetical protein